ncbi:MAG: acetate--CoA ligase family protein, partial [Deltaproteobacteria bacterium]|nr:acetate--CoA ligase family protein [Deltaproteobacteria bacterium]
MSQNKISNTVLNESQAKEILKRYDVPVVNETVALHEEEAIHAAREIGFPVVLKGLGSRLIHKTERSLVHLNLADAQAVRNAAISIAEKAGDDLEGLLIQPYLAGKREFVAGFFRDELFGPVVMFGLGGVFTEALSDITFRLAPLSETDASEMLDDIQSKSLIGKFRGESEVDRDQLIQTLTGLSRIGTTQPEIKEIDINPLLVTSNGKVYAVDALIITGDKHKEKQFSEPVDPDSLKALFSPKSIAFVGASSQIKKWGNMLLSSTISGGFSGNIYPLNPRREQILGQKVYKTIADIPGDVDLAVVTIEASRILDLIPQLKDKAIKHMLLITSGFSETGQHGKAMAKQVVKSAKESGILMIGPNTMGICNPHINFYCTGIHVRPKAGSTAIISQSGNIGNQLLAFAEQEGIGVRLFVGSGNEAMITVEDYLEFLGTDTLTRTIMLYVESIKNGRRFFEIASRVGKKKPIVLLKGGESNAGNRAASSHTGALASNSKVFKAACRQAGIVKVDEPMDLLDLSAVFASLPLPKGNHAAIMTLGGGWGVVAADQCSKYGIDVPALSPEIIERIDRILPPYWSKTNPIDIVGQLDNTIPLVLLEELLKWEGCDAVINLGILGRRLMLERIADSVLESDPSYPLEALENIRKEYRDFETLYIEQSVRLTEK